MLDLALIDEATHALRGLIRRTPMEASGGLADALGVPVTLKLECLQVTGSFKIRGAAFALARLTAAQQVEQAQEASGVDGDRRGETLTVEEFGALALALKLLR